MMIKMLSKMVDVSRIDWLEAVSVENDFRATCVAILPRPGSLEYT